MFPIDAWGKTLFNLVGFKIMNTRLLRLYAANLLFVVVAITAFSYFVSTIPSSLADELQSSFRFIWQYADGRIAAVDYQGANVKSSTFLNNGRKVGAGWKIKAFADFNSDGQTDILWQQENGLMAVWLMNNLQIQKAVILNNGKPVTDGWQIVSARDMDGDGKSDILWQNDDGRIALWSMNGTKVLNTKLLFGGKHIDPSWRLVGIGDFTGNNSKDLLWQNKNGQLAVWFMNGINFGHSELLNNGYSVSKEWTVVGLEDYNGDGQKEILWKDRKGQQAVWFMNPANRTILSHSTLIGTDPNGNSVGGAITTVAQVVVTTTPAVAPVLPPTAPIPAPPPFIPQPVSPTVGNQP